MKNINAINLQPGMKLGEDIMGENDILLASKGDLITDRVISMIRKLDIPNVLIQVDDENLFSENDRNETIDLLTNAFTKYEILNTPVFNKISNQASECLNQILLENEALLALVALRNIDEYTFNHSVHVGLLSGMIGKLLDYDDDTIKKLIYAGLYHDIGKLAINKSILLKPFKLSEEEFNKVKDHSNYALDYISGLSFISEDAMTAIKQHHERHDGSGYPAGYTSEKIHKLAGILAVADIYDASVSDKVYGLGMSPFDACDDLFKNSLDKLDTEVAQVLIKHLQKRYVGLEVTLSNGKKGKVVYLNKFDANRPLVQCGNEFYDLASDLSLKIVKVE